VLSLSRVSDQLLTTTLYDSKFAFAPNSDALAVASDSGDVTVWDLRSGAKLLALSGAQGYSAEDVTYSPDGSRIALATNAEVQIWDARTGQAELSIRGHSDSINSVSFSPDGRTLVTTSEDHTAIVWDAQTGQRRFVLRGHTDGVTGAQYSPDGRFILTTSNDGTVRQYAASIDELMALAHTRVTRDLTPEERAVYLGESITQLYAQGTSTAEAEAQATFTAILPTIIAARPPITTVVVDAPPNNGNGYTDGVVWNDSGLYVQKGEQLRIDYVSGTWSPCLKSGCPYVDAAGVPLSSPGWKTKNERGTPVSILDWPDNVVTNCAHGAVVGRIGESEPFCIGMHYSSKADEAGYLQLGINDKQLDDDKGYIAMRVEIK